MDVIIGCCGAVCSDCERFPNDCKGCSEIKGIVHWLQYTGEPICGIYDCCVNEKGLPHCGRCSGFPCGKRTVEDPRKSHEENMKVLEEKISRLRLMG